MWDWQNNLVRLLAALWLLYELAALAGVFVAGPALLHVSEAVFVADMALGAVPFAGAWWLWRRLWA